MIDLYTFATPNGRKVSMMLEEIGLPYAVHVVDITAGEQFAPAFQAINPNGKIPAIVDPDGPDGRPIAVFESGAILIYLAEKTGQLLPTEPRAQIEVLQWLMWQMGGVGPMFGQYHHFKNAAPERIAYATNRYETETRRLYGVLDARLDGRDFIAGDGYSIADVAVYPWVERHTVQGIDLGDYPAVARWFSTVSERPATARGLDVPSKRQMAEHRR